MWIIVLEIRLNYITQFWMNFIWNPKLMLSMLMRSAHICFEKIYSFFSSFLKAIQKLWMTFQSPKVWRLEKNFWNSTINGILQILWALLVRIFYILFKTLFYLVLTIYYFFTVVGNQSLDELECMIKEHFDKVVNKNVTPPIWEEHPYDAKENGGTITHVN